MAQLVARLHGMQKVRGSNPLSSTSFRICVRLFKTRPRTWAFMALFKATDGARRRVR
jgi:prephenate dehydrogenase